MTVTLPAVRVTLVRPVTPSAFEVRPRVRLPASEPAAAAVTTTLAELPATIEAVAPVRPRETFEAVVARSSLSW